MFQYCVAIIKCYKGIVIGRYDYEPKGATAKGSDITATRSPEEAPLLANRHITLDCINTMLRSSIG